MSITIAAENGERLSENLLFEILSRLPVKDVLQYKSVCKSWYCFISTPHFISKHLKNNRYYNDNCLLANNRVTLFEHQLCQLFLDQTPRVLANQVLSKIPMHKATIYGPCDGLYYLNSGDYRALWNPAINEVRTLPPPPITMPDPPPNTTYSPHGYYGFGLDPLSGDYKVVAIKAYQSTIDEIAAYPNLVLVYSLSNDSWKLCGDLVRRYYLKKNRCYIFVRGCCFWLGSSSPEDDDYIEIIISFDTTSDSFQELPVPAYQHSESDSLGMCYDSTLGMYDDSLAFFSVEENERNLGIWTLNDGTWTKIFNIGPIPNVWYSLGYWKSNKVLLVCEDKKLLLCDPNTREIKDLEFYIHPNCEGIFAYMESLISVKDKNSMGKMIVRWK